MFVCVFFSFVLDDCYVFVDKNGARRAKFCGFGFVIVKLISKIDD